MHPDRERASYHSKSVLIVAGEQSGDLHGSNLVREMCALDPGIGFFGIGGDLMRKAGVRLVAHSSQMAVVGLTEVVTKLGFILSARRTIKGILKKTPPDLVILIDYPDFNMSLAKFAKNAGIPVFYYISPQVWAWRRKRIYFLEKYVDRLAVILPFEAACYEPTGLDVHFVGHPLLDAVRRKYPREEALERFGLHPEKATVALLPGSREKEVENLLPSMLCAARIIAEKIPDSQFVLPLAEAISSDLIRSIMATFPLDITVVKHDTYDAMGISDAAMVASGTATLEAALLEIPMIIVYKVSLFSYLMGRIVINVDRIGLVNLIAGKEVVPEFIQGEAEPEKMARELVKIITDVERRKVITSGLREVREKLGSAGAAARAAALACELIRESQGAGSGVLGRTRL